MQSDCETYYPSEGASNLIFLMSAMANFNGPAGNIQAGKFCV